MNHIVVIEAPGKISTIARLFKERGETVLIAATQGHLYDLPRDDLGLDLNRLSAQQWEVRNPKQLARVKAALEKADCVTVLTDADVEGEVIAQEVYDLMTLPVPVQRARLSALTSDALDKALRTADPVPDRNLVAEGLARRITDRVIGYAFQEPSRHRVAMGRVVTPALASLVSDPPVAGQVEVVLENPNEPTLPWRIVIPFRPQHAEQAQSLARLLSTTPLPRINQVRRTEVDFQLPPHHLGSALSSLSERFGTSLQMTEDTLQELYMQGRMTYLRTGSTHLSPDSIRHIERQAAAQGHHLFRRDKVAAVGTVAGPHEALVPLGEFPMGEPLADLPFDEQCLRALSERLIDAGQPAKLITEYGQFHPDQAAEAWSQALRNWTPIYLVRQWRTQPPFAKPVPWEGDRAIDARGRPVSRFGHVAIYRKPPERQVLDCLLKLELGQPSTLGAFSRSIANRFLDKDGVVNGLGHQALAHARQKLPSLFRPASIVEMEDCFSSGIADASERARRALGCLGVQINGEGLQRTAGPTL